MYLSATEIKKLLKKWHFYKAVIITSQEEGLSKKNKCDRKTFTKLRGNRFRNNAFADLPAC